MCLLYYKNWQFFPEGLLTSHALGIRAWFPQVLIPLPVLGSHHYRGHGYGWHHQSLGTIITILWITAQRGFSGEDNCPVDSYPDMKYQLSEDVCEQLLAQDLICMYLLLHFFWCQIWFLLPLALLNHFYSNTTSREVSIIPLNIKNPRILQPAHPQRQIPCCCFFLPQDIKKKNHDIRILAHHSCFLSKSNVLS